MKKVVLDKFGSAWGTVDVDKEVRRISVARTHTDGGTPVGREDRKVSSNKKYFKELEANGNFTTFVSRKYAGCYQSFTYYFAV